MVSSGYLQAVRWGNETAYGSTAVINKDLGLVQSISPGERNNLIKLRTMGGSRDFKTILPGKFEISGAMDYFLQGGAFLRQAWGEDSGSTAATDIGPKILLVGTVFRHVMGSAASPGVNDFPSFSLEFTDYEDAGTSADTANLKRTYSGCRVNNLTISGTIDEPVRVSADWMAKRVVVSTAAKTSITEYSKDPFVFYDGFVYLTTGVPTSITNAATLKPDALCQVLNFDLGVNNNCEAGYYIAGTCSTTDTARGAKYIIPKGREYSLKLGLHYKNAELYRRFLGAVTATTDQKSPTKFQVVLDMVKTGAINSTVASTDHYMRAVVASASFDDVAINGAPEDIVTNDVNVFGKSCKLYFIDGVSSYK